MTEPNKVPRTEIELEKWMKDNCYNFNSYSINGNAIYEGFGIDKINGSFNWYYIERGQKNNLKNFNTEQELIEYAFNQIESDQWAKAHCIGFTEELKESKELLEILTNINIIFFQDEIPYFGPKRPVYRTFVYGCDLNKVNHLKKKFFKENKNNWL